MRQFNPDIHHRRSIRLRGYDYSQDGLYFVTICCQDGEWLFGDIAEGNKKPSRVYLPHVFLNEAGKVVNRCWLQIPDHFPNAILHAYVIMPNHIHGIIELTTDSPAGVQNVGVQNVGVQNVGVQNLEPLRENDMPTGNNQTVGGPHVGVQNVGVQNLEPLRENDMPTGDNQTVGGPHVGVQNVGDQNLEPLRENGAQPLRKINEFQKIIPRSIGSIVRGFKTGVTRWFHENTEIQKVWERNYYEHIIRDQRAYHAITRYIINNPSNWEKEQFNPYDKHR